VWTWTNECKKFLEAIVMKVRNVIFFIALLAMSTQVWAVHTAGGCAGCHSAHNTTAGTIDGLTIPLWSGDLATGSAFIPYESATMDAYGIGSGPEPDGDSLMCLSCHDGSGAGIAGVDNLTTDLSDDHPISFVYDTALATPATGDDNLNDPSITLIPGGGAGEFIDTEWLDGSSKIQCTTCHDVHNNNIHDTMLLREPAATLCSVCHTQ
jgi:predicted CXXCH cytochrome family protein